MARYREYCYEQSRLLPVSLKQQIQPGTFEYTINYLIDKQINLAVFEERYENDETGAPAIDPAILLKVKQKTITTLHHEYAERLTFAVKIVRLPALL